MFQPPLFNLKCNLANFTDPGTWVTPGAPYALAVSCNARSPRQNEAVPLFFGGANYAVVVVIGFPPGTSIPDLRTSFPHPVGDPVTAIELPAGSGNWYRALWSRPEARGFVNAHVNSYCDRISQAAPSV